MNIKMADVFTSTTGVCIHVNLSCLRDFKNDGITPFHMIDKAVSEYDANQALIAKQAEQIKMLRDALELFMPEIYYNQNGKEVDVGGNFTIYSDGDADNEAMQKVHEALEAIREQS